MGNVENLSQTDIQQQAEMRMPKTKWNATIIELLKRLPLPTITVREWKEEMVAILASLIASDTIMVHNNRTAAEIIKVKRSDKKHPQFLDRALLDYFEKKSSSDTTVSSVHGVKGETFFATLLIIDSTTGANALTPTILNNGMLNSELIRIAYVAMTRPRKLLVVSIPKSRKALTRFPVDAWDYMEI